MFRRYAPALVFVLSAALMALALRLTWDAPIAGAALFTTLLVGLGFRAFAQRRMREALRSGNIERVLARWSKTVRGVPHPETMGPLMEATAFAAYGWVERARAALSQAERGPAWDAAVEHRLFVDTLLLTFEGDLEEAEQSAARLERLPLPSAAPAMVRRIAVLRGAVGALTRAFSHKSREGDEVLMLQAGSSSPLVHWAMRYGAAVFAIDDGDLEAADKLVSNAPRWPEQSRFHRFHHEIVAEVARRRADLLAKA
ncbi:MAG: hypothetical protein AAGA56_23380 [Myxococcota bacterium]